MASLIPHGFHPLILPEASPAGVGLSWGHDCREGSASGEMTGTWPSSVLIFSLRVVFHFIFYTISWEIFPSDFKRHGFL